MESNYALLMGSYNIFQNRKKQKYLPNMRSVYITLEKKYQQTMNISLTELAYYQGLQISLILKC